MDPQTDREFLIQIHQNVIQLNKDMADVKEKIEERPDKEYCRKEHHSIELSQSAQDIKIDDHENRITKVERRIMYLLGVGAGATAVVSIIWQIIKNS